MMQPVIPLPDANKNYITMGKNKVNYALLMHWASYQLNYCQWSVHGM